MLNLHQLFRKYFLREFLDAQKQKVGAVKKVPAGTSTYQASWIIDEAESGSEKTMNSDDEDEVLLIFINIEPSFIIYYLNLIRVRMKMIPCLKQILKMKIVSMQKNKII